MASSNVNGSASGGSSGNAIGTSNELFSLGDDFLKMISKLFGIKSPYETIGMEYAVKIIPASEVPQVTDNIKSVGYKIKESTKANAGNGLFITGDVKAGEWFTIGEATGINLVMLMNYSNDLAYISPGSYKLTDVAKYTNVIYGAVKDPTRSVEQKFHCLYALQDIPAGGELSRCYGSDYWKQFDSTPGWH